MSYILFISEQKLKDSTAINGNVDADYILPYIITAQKKHIETILGTDLFVKLQNDISGSTLTGAYQTLIDSYISDALAHWSFYECLPFLTYKIQNNSVVSKSSDNSQSIDRSEQQYLREEVRNTAEFYTSRIIDYIKNNSSSFPEYSTNSGADISPSKNAFYTGMNLESNRKVRRGINLGDFLTAEI